MKLPLFVVAPLRLSLALAALVFSPRSVAQNPGFQKFLSAATISGAEISPDGTRVLYSVRSADWKANTYRRQVWIAEVASGRKIQLTRRNGIGTAHWSPDNHRIGFLVSQDGSSQIYLIDTNGGEAAKLTDIKDGVEDFAWSPDGKQIAYTTSPPDLLETKRKETLGSFVIFEGDESRSRVGVLDVSAGLPVDPVPGKLLTESQPFSVTSFVWSPNSKNIALSSQPGSALRHILNNTLYTLDVGSDTLTKLAGPGALGNLVWSPDGGSLAFTWTQKTDQAFYANPGVFTIPSIGGTPKEIPIKFDEQVSLEKWGETGILFSAQIRTSYGLFQIDPVSAGVTEVTPHDLGMRAGWTFSRDLNKTAYSTFRKDQYEEVGVSNLQDFNEKIITDEGAIAVAGMTLPVKEAIHWKSKDGTEIEGVLTKPHDFDPRKKYPLIVMIHGGPTGTSDLAAGVPYAYPVDAFVNRGAIILEPNYRGSAGYGAAFRALNVRNLGVGDEWDVLSGVDNLLCRGFVDENRLGCMGWSEGGYISAFITTTSTRFKAISVGAGIADWATYYYLTDITDFTRQYLKADPWTDPEIYRKTSPITYVKNAKTPTLIQQGSNDSRVPVPNGYELFRALQDLHVPSKFILYTGFGHGITNPKEQMALYQHNWEWFGHYLWGDALPVHE